MEESYPAIERARQVFLELRRRQRGLTVAPPVTLEEEEESQTEPSMGTGSQARPGSQPSINVNTPLAQVRYMSPYCTLHQSYPKEPQRVL